jgi:hypothetical protein
MAKFEDNISPYLSFVEGAAPSSPAATNFRLFYDSADHLLKWKNSAGVVTAIATGTPLTDPTTTRGDIITRGVSAIQRLAVGAAGTLLGSNGTDPAWVGTAWGVYTPAWTATTTNPVLGNGTLQGRYRAIDANTYLFMIKLLLGTTTTTGTGTWQFSLPATLANADYVFAANLLHAGVTNYPATASANIATSIIDGIYYPSGNVVNSTAPWTWVSTDSLRISGMFEA